MMWSGRVLRAHVEDTEPKAEDQRQQKRAADRATSHEIRSGLDSRCFVIRPRADKVVEHAELIEQVDDQDLKAEEDAQGEEHVAAGPGAGPKPIERQPR